MIIKEIEDLKLKKTKKKHWNKIPFFKVKQNFIPNKHNTIHNLIIHDFTSSKKSSNGNYNCYL
jgi:hypothetical protein